jgi:hypothetical protein
VVLHNGHGLNEFIGNNGPTYTSGVHTVGLGERVGGDEGGFCSFLVHFKGRGGLLVKTAVNVDLVVDDNGTSIDDLVHLSEFFLGDDVSKRITRGADDNNLGFIGEVLLEGFHVQGKILSVDFVVLDLSTGQESAEVVEGVIREGEEDFIIFVGQEIEEISEQTGGTDVDDNVLHGDGEVILFFVVLNKGLTELGNAWGNDERISLPVVESVGDGLDDRGVEGHFLLGFTKGHSDYILVASLFSLVGHLIDNEHQETFIVPVDVTSSDE